MSPKGLERDVAGHPMLAELKRLVKEGPRAVSARLEAVPEWSSVRDRLDSAGVTIGRAVQLHSLKVSKVCSGYRDITPEDLWRSEGLTFNSTQVGIDWC